MNNLILLRHGQSQWNLENRFTGLTDVSLTEDGINEAKKAGYLMKKNNLKIDIIFSSDLKRSIDTAYFAIREMYIENLWNQNKLILNKNKNLNERDYGDLVGLNKKDTAEKYGSKQVQIWRRSFDIPPPGGESLKDVLGRVGPFYEKFIEPLIINKKNVLISAHGNSLRATLIKIGLYKPQEISKIEIPTGVPFLITYNNSKIEDYRFLN